MRKDLVTSQCDTYSPGVTWAFLHLEVCSADHCSVVTAVLVNVGPHIRISLCETCHLQFASASHCCRATVRIEVGAGEGGGLWLECTEALFTRPCPATKRAAPPSAASASISVTSGSAATARLRSQPAQDCSPMANRGHGSDTVHGMGRIYVLEWMWSL